MSDIAAYWAAVDAELADCPAAPVLTPSPLRETDYATLYEVKLSSIGAYRLFGFLSIPKGTGPFPGLYLTPRYGSVNNVPHPDDRRRYVVFQLMHRGQRLADQPFSAPYPGLLTMGIDDPDTYIYRSIVADCLRGAEFLLSQPALDHAHVGVIGGDLALLVASLRPSFTTVQSSGLLFYRAGEACLQSTDYPLEEFNDYLRTYPEQTAAIANTLSYFDPQWFAPKITARAMFPTGDPGTIGGTEWLAPLRESCGGPVEEYRLTHEGGTDHDTLDRWQAEQLGTTPRPRVWRIEG